MRFKVGGPLPDARTWCLRGDPYRFVKLLCARGYLDRGVFFNGGVGSVVTFICIQVVSAAIIYGVPA